MIKQKQFCQRWRRWKAMIWMVHWTKSSTDFSLATKFNIVCDRINFYWDRPLRRGRMNRFRINGCSSIIHIVSRIFLLAVFFFVLTKHVYIRWVYETSFVYIIYIHSHVIYDDEPLKAISIFDGSHYFTAYRLKILYWVKSIYISHKVWFFFCIEEVWKNILINDLFPNIRRTWLYA